LRNPGAALRHIPDFATLNPGYKNH
jgi:hypothetical protein